MEHLHAQERARHLRQIALGIIRVDGPKPWNRWDADLIRDGATAYQRLYYAARYNRIDAMLAARKVR